MLTLTFHPDHIEATFGAYTLTVERLRHPELAVSTVIFHDPTLRPLDRPRARVLPGTLDLDNYLDSLASVVQTTVANEDAQCWYRVPGREGTPELYFASLDELVPYLTWSGRNARVLVREGA